jgi:hypothetical protein
MKKNVNFMKMKNNKRDSERPDMETLRRGRRVTPEEHAMYSKALDEKYGVDRPRLGRRPGDPKDRYIPTYIKLHPRIVAWAKAKAKMDGIGYQTVINQTLLRIAA